MIEWIIFHIILVAIFYFGVKYQRDADKHINQAKEEYGYDIMEVN